MINPDFAVASVPLTREPAPAFPTPKKSSPRTAMFVEAIACSFARGCSRRIRWRSCDPSSPDRHLIAIELRRVFPRGGRVRLEMHTSPSACVTSAAVAFFAFTRRRCPIRSACSLARYSLDIGRISRARSARGPRDTTVESAAHADSSPSSPMSRIESKLFHEFFTLLTGQFR